MTGPQLLAGRLKLPGEFLFFVSVLVIFDVPGAAPRERRLRPRTKPDNAQNELLRIYTWQRSHSPRIFKAMATDHDGTVTLAEMGAFMRGTSRPASSH